MNYYSEVSLKVPHSLKFPSKNPDSDASASVLNGRKNRSKQRNIQVCQPCAQPAHHITDLFKRAIKRKEEQLQNRVDYNLTEDNSTIILIY